MCKNYQTAQHKLPRTISAKNKEGEDLEFKITKKIGKELLSLYRAGSDVTTYNRITRQFYTSDYKPADLAILAPEMYQVGKIRK